MVKLTNLELHTNCEPDRTHTCIKYDMTSDKTTDIKSESKTRSEASLPPAET